MTEMLELERDDMYDDLHGAVTSINNDYEHFKVGSDKHCSIYYLCPSPSGYDYV